LLRLVTLKQIKYDDDDDDDDDDEILNFHFAVEKKSKN